MKPVQDLNSSFGSQTTNNLDRPLLIFIKKFFFKDKLSDDDTYGNDFFKNCASD